MAALFCRAIEIDCRGPTLPDGITIAPAGDKGLGLFATKRFAPGRLVYRYSVRLTALETRIRLRTDHGTRKVTPRTHGSGPVQIDILRHAPPEALRRLADMLGVAMPADRDAAINELWRVMTDSGRKVFFMSSFDSFINHAWQPNCVYGKELCSFEMRDGRLTGWYELFAVDYIRAGEELTVDYETINKAF